MRNIITLIVGYALLAYPTALLLTGEPIAVIAAVVIFHSYDYLPTRRFRILNYLLTKKLFKS